MYFLAPKEYGEPEPQKRPLFNLPTFLSGLGAIVIEVSGIVNQNAGEVELGTALGALTLALVAYQAVKNK